MSKETCVRLAGELVIGPNLSSYGLGELLDERGRGTGFYAWISWRWGEQVTNLDVNDERGELREGDCLVIERRPLPYHGRVCWRPVLRCPQVPRTHGS